MDKLSEILSHFTVSSGVFHIGRICGSYTYGDASAQTGHVHILKQGQLEIVEPNRPPRVIQGPNLLFYPRPLHHEIKAEDFDNTELVCASVLYGAGPDNPLSLSLPPVMTLPLTDRNDRLASVVDWLFDEAFSENAARRVVMDKLCELMLVQLLRVAMESGDVHTGMLAGLSHPQISRAIHAIHATPSKNWSLQDLAEESAMSRSRFAELFKSLVGQPPRDYLVSWRVELAKTLLRANKSVGWVADEVGYDNASALARVFRKKTGFSPKEWLGATQQVE